MRTFELSENNRLLYHASNFSRRFHLKTHNVWDADSIVVDLQYLAKKNQTTSTTKQLKTVEKYQQCSIRLNKLISKSASIFPDYRYHRYPLQNPTCDHYCNHLNYPLSHQKRMSSIPNLSLFCYCKTTISISDKYEDVTCIIIKNNDIGDSIIIEISNRH